MKNKIEFCANILNEIKKEIDKRNILYDHGVDLINYENKYTECLMATLCYILDKENIKEDLDWWLYEDVDKIICIDKKEYNVHDSYDFLKTVMYIE